MDTRINELIHSLLRSQGGPNETYECPVCNGVLHLKFSSFTRRGKNIAGVNIYCPTCNINIMADYALKQLPPWIKQ